MDRLSLREFVRGLQLSSRTTLCVTLLAALVSFGACDGEAPAPAPPPEASVEIAEGTLYLMAGVSPFEAELLEVRPDGRAPERLTDGARISSLAPFTSKVLVATARQKIDHLELWDEGGFHPVPGLGRPHAFTPAAQGRRIAFVAPVGTADELRFHLRVLGADGTLATVYRSRETLSFPAWSGGGLFVLEGAGEDARIVRIADRTHAASAPGATILVGEGHVLGWSAFGGASGFLDTSDDSTSGLDGWDVLCADLNGGFVVADGPILGTYAPSTGAVEPLGTTGAESVYDCAWLP